MQLTTRRFVLRDFTANDAAAFLAYHADPRASQLYAPGENTPEHAAQLLRVFESWTVEEPRTNYQLAVVRRDGQLVGCAGLRMKGAAPGRAELGMELAPSCWGQFAYAIEIMKCLVEFGFTKFDLVEIFGSTVSESVRIARLATAFGAVSVERATPAWMAAKGWRQIEWRIDREQWFARPSNKRL